MGNMVPKNASKYYVSRRKDDPATSLDRDLIVVCGLHLSEFLPCKHESRNTIGKDLGDRWVVVHLIKTCLIRYWNLNKTCSKFQIKTLLSDGGRVEREKMYVDDMLGFGAGATNAMLNQSPSPEKGAGAASILTSKALLLHLEIMKRASKVVVEKDYV